MAPALAKSCCNFCGTRPQGDSHGTEHSVLDKKVTPRVCRRGLYGAFSVAWRVKTVRITGGWTPNFFVL